MKLRLIALALALFTALTPVLSFSLPDGCFNRITEEDIVVPADPLDGVWVRQDDDPAFDGLTLDVTRRKDGTYIGVIVSMSDALVERGFAAGDRKWKNVTVSEDGGYMLYDLGIHDGTQRRYIPKELHIDEDDPDRLTLTVYIPPSMTDAVSGANIPEAQVYVCKEHREPYEVPEAERSAL